MFPFLGLKVAKRNDGTKQGNFKKGENAVTGESVLIRWERKGNSDRWNVMAPWVWNV